MKNNIRIIPIILCIILCLTSCGKKDKLDLDEMVGDPTQNTGQEGTTSTATDTKPEENADEQGSGVNLDITSERELKEFIKGDWYLMDTINGEDIGCLSVSSNADVMYERLVDHVKARGSLEFVQGSYYDTELSDLKTMPEYTYLSFHFDDIPAQMAVPAIGYYQPEEDTSGVDFLIGSDAGEDYIYMNWTGNGDSYTFFEMFQNSERITHEVDELGEYTGQTTWVLHRDNDRESSVSPLKNETFYGFVWKNLDAGKMWIQPMDVHSYESYEDYSNRHFTAASFNSRDEISITEYDVSVTADLSLMYDLAWENDDYPLTMYEVTTDSDGRISALSLIPKYLHYTYDLGDLEPQYSYDGLTFTYNDVPYDMTAYAPAVNAIMDMYQVGEWIVIEGHINPHHSAYCLLNIYTGNVEKTIVGANLTWKDDDLTTAVYSDMYEVFNFKGNVICYTDDEVMEIVFEDNGSTLKITDALDRVTTINGVPTDESMYRYASYCRNKTAYTWKAFMDTVPNDAMAFVLVNPPEEVRLALPRWPDPVDEDTEDAVYAVALGKDLHVHLDQGTPDYSGPTTTWKSDRTLRVHDLEPGDCVAYQMLVPEGIPGRCMFMSDDRDGVRFIVAPITGESDICGLFLTPSMSAKEALDAAADETSSESEGPTTMSELLYLYKEAQDGRYSETKLDELGIRTELIQQAWPWAAPDDSVEYQLYDVNSDNKPELIITYYGSIIEIYGSDGTQINYAYGCPYRGEATLYPNGMLEELYAPSMNHASTRWYQYDGEMGRYFPVFEETYNIDKDSKTDDEFYTFSYYADPEEIREHWRAFDTVPEYAWEWADMISADEYKKLCPSGEGIKLPAGDKLKDFAGF